MPASLPWLIKDTYILRAAVATRGVSLVRFRSLARLPRVATCAAYEGDTTGSDRAAEAPRGVSLNRFAQSLACPAEPPAPPSGKHREAGGDVDTEEERAQEGGGEAAPAQPKAKRRNKRGKGKGKAGNDKRGGWKG